MSNSNNNGLTDEYWYNVAKRRVREGQKRKKNTAITVVFMLAVGAALAAFLTYCA